MFELKGCNVAQLDWDDLLQADVSEGPAASHMGGVPEGKLVGWSGGVDKHEKK